MGRACGFSSAKQPSGSEPMEFSSATVWWVLAGLLVAAELLTGTFYLLMVALGMAGAAVAAHLGLAFTPQLMTAALLGGGATAVWHWHRAKQPRSAPAHMNRDVNLDIGERIKVAAWEPDGTARVSYRGSMWSARLAPGTDRAAGEYTVSAVEGNHLVLQANTATPQNT
jgi:membrane protein implicated in regulation of membrane protease activity